jgi:hypothetical protein
MGRLRHHRIKSTQANRALTQALTLNPFTSPTAQDLLENEKTERSQKLTQVVQRVKNNETEHV